MLDCTTAKAILIRGSPPDLPEVDPVDAMYRAVLTCELAKLEKAIHAYQHDLNGLILLVEALGRIVNNRELVVTAKRFSWKRGATIKWGVVCEFSLPRAQRILLLPSEPDLPALVLEHRPGTAGTRSCESPALLMKQIGKIAALPSCFAPPPLVCSVS